MIKIENYEIKICIIINILFIILQIFCTLDELIKMSICIIDKIDNLSK